MNTPSFLTITAALSITTALGISGCASDASHSPAPPEATMLSGEQIKSALSGKTFNSVTGTGKPFSMTFNPDRTEIFQEAGGLAQTERWVIEGDQVCISSPTYAKECSEVKATGQALWFIVPGTQKTRNRFLKE
jgi:hypothetical protein